MLRALPILIILGLAIYSFFDVLKTEDLLIRRGPKTMWLVVALVPVFGAALWFLIGRPVRERDAYPAPRVIQLKRQQKQVAPDDDLKFLRKLDQEAWLRQRNEVRSREANPSTGPASTGPGPNAAADPDAPVEERSPANDSPVPDGPASESPSEQDSSKRDVSEESADGQSSAKEKSTEE